MSQIQQTSITGNDNIKLYSIPEICVWNENIVILPAMQRGFVWKAGQVEKLWDSLLRGFPVGSFLVTPTLKEKTDANASCANPQKNFISPLFLLDGQQRATAIRLAKCNPWAENPNTAKISRENQSESNTTCPAVLWVDLDSSGLDPTDDREFVFRLITISQPWGYNRKNSEQTLTASERREARKKFTGETTSTFSKDIDWDLRTTWPCDARIPVPFYLLWEAVEKNISDQGDDAIKNTWSHLCSAMKENRLFEKLKGNLLPFNAAFEKDGMQPPKGFELFYNGLKPLIDEKHLIPAVILKKETLLSDKNPQSESKRPDPVQTLFLRTQRGGTILEGEELHYSMLKAELPEICKVIDGLSHKLARPSRLAILLVRMTYALQNPDSNTPTAFPPDPGLGQFRNWVKEPKFIIMFSELSEHFINMLDTAKMLLEQPNVYALPPVLSAHLFRKSPHLMLVYLSWICKIGCASARTLSEKEKRTLIGFLTAVSWFAVNEFECAKRLWYALERTDTSILKNFWNTERFQSLLPLLETHNYAHCMLPLPSPKCVEQYFYDTLLNTQDFHVESTVWNSWPQYKIDSNDLLKSFFATTLKYDHKNMPENRRHIEAWDHFLGILRMSKPLLFYAQRDLFVEFFSKFDPSLPERIEDTSTPWDYDHIHASAYRYYVSYIPPLITWWHGTIGNLRAWPAALNRSDRADSPSEKFFVDENTTYNKQEICQYSAIKHIDQWEATAFKDCKKGYLGDVVNHIYREALIKAIITRMNDIYKEWYTELHIETLMVCKTDKQ